MGLLSSILFFFFFLFFFYSTAQYCKLPKEPHVQPHDWEQYGPNGPLCGELRGWAMNHGCFINGTTCGQTCQPGECFCIYACEPGYCMTQFNPAFDNINDPSHGVLCQLDGTIKKVYKPNASLCVPCTTKDPNDPSLGVVTKDGKPSPASFITTMDRATPICGLMDPGVDDGLQLGVVTKNSVPLYAHMFPQWWYLPSIQSQIYIQIPDTNPETSCVTKKNPLLSPPEGNAGFNQVAFTAGGGIQYETYQGIQSYVAHGQVAFFGDFGSNNNLDLSVCWKFYKEKCVVNYGIKAYVCASNETFPNCRLDCELYLHITNVSNEGKQANICKKIRKCNLNYCPPQTKCLGSSDPVGCNPIANIDGGERIVYELFEDIGNTTTLGEPDGSLWWISLIVVGIVVVIGVVCVKIAMVHWKKRYVEEESL